MVVITLLYMINKDISQLKQQQYQLEEQQFLYKRLLETKQTKLDIVCCFFINATKFNLLEKDSPKVFDLSKKDNNSDSSTSFISLNLLECSLNNGCFAPNGYLLSGFEWNCDECDGYYNKN